MTEADNVQTHHDQIWGCLVPAPFSKAVRHLDSPLGEREKDESRRGPAAREGWPPPHPTLHPKPSPKQPLGLMPLPRCSVSAGTASASPYSTASPPSFHGSSSSLPLPNHLPSQPQRDLSRTQICDTPVLRTLHGLPNTWGESLNPSPWSSKPFTIWSLHCFLI